MFIVKKILEAERPFLSIHAVSFILCLWKFPYCIQYYNSFFFLQQLSIERRPRFFDLRLCHSTVNLWTTHLDECGVHLLNYSQSTEWVILYCTGNHYHLMVWLNRTEMWEYSTCPCVVQGKRELHPLWQHCQQLLNCFISVYSGGISFCIYARET